MFATQPHVVADSSQRKCMGGRGRRAPRRTRCNARPGALHKPCRVCRTKRCNRRPPPTSMHRATPQMRAPPPSGPAPTPTMLVSPSSTRLYSYPFPLSTTQIHAPICLLPLTLIFATCFRQSRVADAVFLVAMKLLCSCLTQFDLRIPCNSL